MTSNSGIALVMVANAIADPITNWPLIMDEFDQVMQRENCDIIRFGLLTEQEVELLNQTQDGYVHHIAPMNTGFLKVFSTRALEDLLEYSADAWDWWTKTDGRTGYIPWLAEQVACVIVISNGRPPNGPPFDTILVSLLQLGHKVIRIDPETMKTVLVREPRKESNA